MRTEEIALYVSPREFWAAAYRPERDTDNMRRFYNNVTPSSARRIIALADDIPTIAGDKLCWRIYRQ